VPQQAQRDVVVDGADNPDDTIEFAILKNDPSAVDKLILIKLKDDVSSAPIAAYIACTIRMHQRSEDTRSNKDAALFEGSVGVSAAVTVGDLETYLSVALGVLVKVTLAILIVFDDSCGKNPHGGWRRLLFLAFARFES